MTFLDDCAKFTAHHEGKVIVKNAHVVYDDHDSKPAHGVGKLTLGYGINIEEGITEDEAQWLLKQRLLVAYNELRTTDFWYKVNTDARQLALIDMCYNLGLPKLLGFKKMIAAIQVQDWAKAADEALDSLWARQVGIRAERIAEMLKTGRMVV